MLFLDDEFQAYAENEATIVRHQSRALMAKSLINEFNCSSLPHVHKVGILGQKGRQRIVSPDQATQEPNLIALPGTSHIDLILQSNHPVMVTVVELDSFAVPLTQRIYGLSYFL